MYSAEPLKLLFNETLCIFIFITKFSFTYYSKPCTNRIFKITLKPNWYVYIYKFYIKLL